MLVSDESSPLLVSLDLRCFEEVELTAEETDRLGSELCVALGQAAAIVRARRLKRQPHPAEATSEVPVSKCLSSGEVGTGCLGEADIRRLIREEQQMRYITMGAATAALATVATLGSVAPAQAAPPIAVGNLVNVQITNLLNDNEVAVMIPINAAANICVGSVTVAVIAEVLDGGSPFECTSRSGKQELVITQ